VILCSLPDPPRLEGSIKPNNHLHVAEKLYEGKVLGPESIVLDHGKLKLCSLFAKIYCRILIELLVLRLLCYRIKVTRMHLGGRKYFESSQTVTPVPNFGLWENCIFVRKFWSKNAKVVAEQAWHCLSLVHKSQITPYSQKLVDSCRHLSFPNIFL